MDAIRPRADARTSTRLAVAALAALFSLPFLLPLGSDPVPSFEAEWVAFTLGVTALAALATGRHWAVPGVVLLPLGFAALILLQMVAGRVALASHGGLGVLYLLWAAALACAGAWVRGHAQRDRIVAVVAWALLTGALANAGCAAAQVTGFADSWLILPGAGARAGGNLGQPNHLAAHLALGAAAAAYLSGRGQVGTAMSGFIAFVLALGLHWAGSRTGWLMLFVLFAGGLAARPAVGAAAARVWRWQCALVAVLWLALDLTGAARPQRSEAGSAMLRWTTDTGSVLERIRLWEAALAMIRDAPWAGVGYGRFAGAFVERAPGLAPPVPGALAAHAHSLPLQVAAEFGLIGLAMLLVLAGVWVRCALRGRVGPESAWALAVAGALGVHALVEYPLWYAYFLGPFAFALGLAEGPRLEFRIARSGRMALGGIGLTAAVLLFTIAVDFRVIRSFAGGEVARLDAAARDRQVLRLSDLRFQSLLAGYADVGLQRGLSLTPVRLPEKLALSREAVRLFPLPDVTFRHAVLLALSGETGEAALWWSRAVAAYPTHAGAWLVIGRGLGQPGPWDTLATASNFGDDS